MKVKLVPFLSAVMLMSVLLLSAGCSVGPKYARPATAADTNDGYYYAGKNSTDANEIGQWWQRFGDPVTTELVNCALENNYDLKAAAARLLQAEARLVEIRGKQLPEINYNFARSRNKNSFNFGGAGRFSNISTTFTQDVSVFYVLDIFGKLKHAEQAAWAEMLATEANKQALINSLIAAVINTRINIATAQRGLAIAKANTESRQRTLEIVERRYAQGLVGPVDVRLGRGNLAAAKAAEPAIELLLISSRNALDVLVARRPGSSQELPETLAKLPNLEPIPIGLPVELLDRRPDVRAAELQLRGFNEQVGVSVAELFPDLTLSANFGRSADRWRDIWKNETEIYGAIFRMAQPIFKGGQLKARVSQKKARYAEAAANYAQTVLKAIEEVENALARDELLQKRLKFVQQQLEDAAAAENLSTDRYQRGVESILTVLESQRGRRISENELTLLEGEIWTTRVNLFLALGGDWI